jgi:hypothetical protein
MEGEHWKGFQEALMRVKGEIIIVVRGMEGNFVQVKLQFGFMHDTA